MIPVLTLIPNRSFDAPVTLASSQANLEDDRKKRSQDEAEKVDPKCAKMDPEKSDSEASATGEQDDAGKGRCSSVDEVRPGAALPTLSVLLRGVPVLTSWCLLGFIGAACRVREAGSPRKAGKCCFL